MQVVKSWDFQQFLSMGKEQRTAIRRALNEDSEKLIQVNIRKIIIVSKSNEMPTSTCGEWGPKLLVFAYTIQIALLAKIVF